MTTHTPQRASDFEAIYYPDGTCTVFDGTADCRKPGVVLAYDVFSPEVGMWFCAKCWPDFEGLCEIVEDKRIEQAILEAAENASDDLMDLLQKAIETMDEAQAERLMDKVHQVQSESLRDIRGWRE
jgi:hypothetical protein